MNKSTTNAKGVKFILSMLLIVFALNANANVNFIDFSKISVPKKLQYQFDFVRHNDSLYNHWVQEWNYNTPQKEVIEILETSYKALDKLPQKNLETELLLGDIAHYIFNMSVTSYYQKALDHYTLAMNIAPEDYRVYWFLGNHYALADNQFLTLQTYQTAIKMLPESKVTSLFWADYAQACFDANMPGTALYAARQASKISGKMTAIEEQVLTSNYLSSPNSDTSMYAKAMWSVNGKQGNKLIFCNRFLGTRMVMDSTWELRIGDYKKQMSYLTINPPAATAKTGEKIGYSMLLMTKIPEANESLQQFLDKMTVKTQNKKPMAFTAGNLKNCLVYEMKEPELYPQFGGRHMYAIAVERKQPEYPGLALETPLETITVKGEKVEPTYYISQTKYTRVNSSLYYYIFVDSVEAIHEESLSVLKDFVSNLTLE